MRYLTSSWKAVRLQALLLLLTVAALGALGELSIRALHYIVRGTPWLSAAGSSSQGLIEPDDILGWRVAAGRDATYDMRDSTGAVHSVQYRTGQHGFRLFGNPDSSDTKILVVGDSFTHAIEISNDRTYYALLQQRLSERVPIQVFAYGAAGYGTLQEVLFVERIFKLVRPQIVVLQLCSNDIVNNSFELELASYVNNNRGLRPYLRGDGSIELRVPQGKLSMATAFIAAHSRLAQWVLLRFNRLMAFNARTRTVEHEIRTTGFAHPGFRRALAATESILVRLKSGLPATTKLYAFSVDRNEPFTSALNALVVRSGIALIDGIGDAVEAARLRGEPVLAADRAHWAPAGHQIAAEVVARALLADLNKK